MGDLILPRYEVEEINVWSEEHDQLPLKQRLKLLRARSDLFPDSGSEKDEISNCLRRIIEDDCSRRDDGLCDKEFAHAGCPHPEGKSGTCSGEENHTGELGEWNDRWVEANVASPSIVLAEKVKSLNDSHSHSAASVGMSVLGADKSLSTSSTFAGNSLCNDKAQKQEAENQKATCFVDELEHIVLKERQRLLLSSQKLRSTKTYLEGKTGQLPTLVVDSSSQQSAKIIKKFSFDDTKEPHMAERYELSWKTSVLRSSDSMILALPSSGDKTFHLGNHSHRSKSVKCGYPTATEEKDTSCSLDINSTPFSACSGLNSMSSKDTVPNLYISNFVNVKGETGQLPTPAVDSSSQQSAKIIEEISFDDIKEPQMAEHHELSQKTSSDAVILAIPSSGDKTFHLGNHSRGSKLVKCGPPTATEKKDTSCSLDINSTPFSAGSGQNSSSSKGTSPNLSISNLFNVKVEPLDINETSISKASVASPVENTNPLKIECEIPYVFDEDVLDHMLLSERMKLQTSYVPCLDVHGIESSGKLGPSAVDCKPITKESPIPLKMNYPRKKRKTATDSVETALEEDAPGLLQVLVEKGISVDEIRLYGQPDYEDDLDDLPTEENFAELEAIISKIFSQRSTLLKLSSMRYMKGEKASYCLGCLFSLVEQAQYLQFRKWPIEWGWCRDLQAFIFVFKRHHRIVLERPEYGYATYFFELTNSLSINWQVQRLIIALKLSSCSRVTLIENKALVVGEDMTEGEAKVMIDYGWIPNTGLGTMLNYCDRVYHDRKTEDPSEWRSKIGKILADGFNGGTIVSDGSAKRLVECSFSDTPSIKLETN